MCEKSRILCVANVVAAVTMKRPVDARRRKAAESPCSSENWTCLVALLSCPLLAFSPFERLRCGGSRPFAFVPTLIG